MGTPCGWLGAVQARAPLCRDTLDLVGELFQHVGRTIDVQLNFTLPTERTGQFPGLPGSEASDDELDRMLKRLAIPV